MTTTHPTCETCKHWKSQGADTIRTINGNEGICKVADIDCDPNTHPYDTALITEENHYCAMHSEVCDG